MNNRAFLMVEVLIASLIISSGIIAGFFLIRSGMLNLSKQLDNSYILSNLPLVINYIELQNSIPSEKKIAGMDIRFKQKVIKKYTPTILAEEDNYIKLPFEMLLIKVDIDIQYKNTIKSYTYYKIQKIQTGSLDEQ